MTTIEYRKDNLIINDYEYEYFRDDEISGIEKYIHYLVKIQRPFGFYTIKFNQYIEFLSVYELLIQTNTPLYFYELLGDNPLLFFDIDIPSTSEYFEMDELTRLETIWFELKQGPLHRIPLRYDEQLDDTSNDDEQLDDTSNDDEQLDDTSNDDILSQFTKTFYIWVNHREDKKSYRLISKYYRFPTMELLKLYITTYYNRCEIFDKTVYSSGRLLRLPYSSKYGKMGKFELLFDTLQEWDDILVCNPLIKKDHCIIDEGIWNPVIETIPKSIHEPPLDISVDEVKQVLQEFNSDYSQLMTIKSIYNNRGDTKSFKLQPTQPYTCFLCKVKHKTTLHFLNINEHTSGMIFWNVICQRNSNKFECIHQTGECKTVDEDTPPCNFVHSVKELFNTPELIKINPNIDYFNTHNYTIHYIPQTQQYLNWETDMIPLLTNHLIVLAMPCESGKTEISIRLSTFYKSEYTIVFITCRNSLGVNTKGRFERADLELELHSSKNKVVKKQTGSLRGISVESLHTLGQDVLDEKKPFILILDEYPDIITQFGSNTQKDKQCENMGIFIKLFKGADKLFLLSATLDRYTLGLCDILGIYPNNRVVILRDEMYHRRRLIIYDEYDSLLSKMYQDLDTTHHPIAIVFTGSVNTTHPKIDKFRAKLQVIHPNKKILCIFGSSPDKEEFCKDPKTYLENNHIDILIFNTAIKVGVDINDITFSEMYFFGTYNILRRGGLTDIIQLIMRIRKLSGNIHFHLSGYSSTKQGSNKWNSMVQYIITHLRDTSNELNFDISNIIGRLIETAVKYKQQTDLINKIISDRDDYFETYWILLFCQYLTMNGIQVDINQDEYTFEVKDLEKDVKKILMIESQTDLNTFNDLPLLTEPEYLQSTTKCIKTRMDYLIERKYRLYTYHNIPNSSLITMDILTLTPQDLSIISNIRLFFHMNKNYILESVSLPGEVDEKEDVDQKDDKDQKDDVDEKDDIDHSGSVMDVIKLEMEIERMIDVNIKGVIDRQFYKNYYRRILDPNGTVNYNVKGINRDGDVEGNLVNKLTGMLNHMNYMKDVNLFEMKRTLQYSKIVLYPVIKLLYQLDLPIFKFTIYTKGKFILKCKDIQTRLRNLTRGTTTNGLKNMERLLRMLGYTKSQKQMVLLMTVEYDRENPKLYFNILLKFLKSIYDVIGCRLVYIKRGEEYHLKMKSRFQRILSVFTQPERISIIPSIDYIHKNWQVDEDTLIWIERLEEFLKH